MTEADKELPPGTTAPITLRIGRHGKIAQTG
jgi:hypothetical protein